MLDMTYRMTSFVKKVVLIVMIISPVITIAQDQSVQGINVKDVYNWPNVDYAYARAYVYNLRSDLRSHHSPVKDGVLDSTVATNGTLLNKKHTDLIKDVVASNGAILLEGLSECYIPHHAVIYYSEKGEIVAWMSVCLMCDGIRLSPNPYGKMKTVYGESAIEKAEERIDELEVMFDSLSLGGIAEGGRFRYNKVIRQSQIDIGAEEFAKIESIFAKLKGGEDIMELEVLVNETLKSENAINLWRINGPIISFKNPKGDNFVLEFKAGKLRCWELVYAAKDGNNSRKGSTSINTCE